MFHFKHQRSFSILITVLVVIVVLLLLHGVGKKDDTQLITATADTGSVRQLVSVSGTAEAEQSAKLSFPVAGIVEEVYVTEGTVVEKGDVLIELETTALRAERQDAVAALNKTIADRDELIAGPTSESRDVTDETVELKRNTLASTIANETKKVENAYRSLLSSNLAALSEDPNEDATPPIITGTYTCESEGEYKLIFYASSADSGYSFRYEGIETGTNAASANQPTTLGDCGLYVQIDAVSNYGRSVWTVSVPNKNASTYITNLNAYNLAKTQADNAIALAEQDLNLALAGATNTNAPARAEALARANASVEQAQARVNRIDATIADRVLRAPFSGTVTAIDILPGETVTTAPIVTVLAEEAFDVKARIPEIDIGKLEVGQKVEMVFDARTYEIVTGEISFISLEATEIDGVAYYEALISFSEVPVWIRSGLNADIDIIITEETDVVRVPKRFVSIVDGEATVLKRDGTKTASTSVTVLLSGDDGWIAITGLNAGDTVVAP